MKISNIHLPSKLGVSPRILHALSAFCVLFVLSSLGAPRHLHAATSPAKPPLRTVATLDVARYMGTWYEISKYPNFFQRNCVSSTSARYRLLDPQKIEVLNRCLKSDGQWQQGLGQARRVGAEGSAQLEVSFAPQWLTALPMLWGKYWIIDLDEDYSLVAISEPRREYLWVLSRTPQVSPEVYSALMKRLEAQGLDTSKLEVTQQP